MLGFEDAARWLRSAGGRIEIRARGNHGCEVVALAGSYSARVFATNRMTSDELRACQAESIDLLRRRMADAQVQYRGAETPS